MPKSNHIMFTLASVFFFFNDTATTEIYTLSLHDALPICQPPSVLAAVDRNDARSLPDSGSDQAWAQICSPLAILGRIRSSCSWVPCANNVGPSIEVPLALARPGAPARKYSSSNTTQCNRGASRPPYFSGQVITDKPASNSTRSQWRCCAKPSALS